MKLPFRLSMRWSHAHKRDNPNMATLAHAPGDILYEWGEGCGSRDGALLHYHFGVRQFDFVTKESRPSLLEELAARGYDLTTLKFSIRKRS